MKRLVRASLFPIAAALAFGGGLASPALADQPYMHDALAQLQAARATLVAGAPDKGGHRVRAIALVDRAIAEVHAGIGFDRRH